MKREDVKNKIPGITEEQLNWLMQENGSDIIREKFLSTLSLRRATACSKYAKYGWVFLSTLSLRRATAKVHKTAGHFCAYETNFMEDCIFMLTGKAVFYPFCPCFFHIFWCEGTGNFMIAFPSH